MKPEPTSHREIVREAESNETFEQTIAIEATDGFVLAASWFPAQLPPGEAGGAPARGVVILNSATAVRRRHYRRFAAYLARGGYHVLTYDYRGIGGSRPETLRGFRARLRDWGERDFAGVLDHVERRHPGLPIVVVGHSVGGQLMGLVPRPERVAGLLGVCAQSGDYRLWPAPARYRMALLWYGVVPLAAQAAGYLPGALGTVEDLPRGVALEWARWCRTPGFLGEGGDRLRDRFRRYQGPVLAYGFTDDPYAPPAAVRGLLDLYGRAPGRHREIRPTDVGARRVGHFGFFRPRFEGTLWREAEGWIGAVARGGAAAVDAWTPTPAPPPPWGPWWKAEGEVSALSA